MGGWTEDRVRGTGAGQYLLSSRHTLSVSGSCGRGDEWVWLEQKRTNQSLTHNNTHNITL